MKEGDAADLWKVQVKLACVRQSAPELCGPLSACHRRRVVGLVCLHKKELSGLGFLDPEVLGTPCPFLRILGHKKPMRELSVHLEKRCAKI